SVFSTGAVPGAEVMTAAGASFSGKVGRMAGGTNGVFSGRTAWGGAGLVASEVGTPPIENQRPTASVPPQVRRMSEAAPQPRRIQSPRRLRRGGGARASGSGGCAGRALLWGWSGTGGASAVLTRSTVPHPEHFT